MPKDKPDNSQSLTAQAYAIIRRDIISRKLPPGADISESELAQQLEMSKTPVREALASLRSEGLVETYPRRGYRISPMTLAEMNELFDIRIILEGGVAALAAERITNEIIDELEQLADSSYEIEKTGSLEHFIEANRHFHSAIAKAAGRPRLEQLVSRNLDDLERYFFLGAVSRDINPETQADHRKIVQAFKERDIAAARDLLVQHNRVTREGLLRVITSGSSRSTLHL